MSPPRMRNYSGRMAPLLIGIAVRQASSRTAQAQASLSRSRLLPCAASTDPLRLRHKGVGMASSQPSSRARATPSEMVEAIGMRLLGIAEEMAAGSRHHGRSERLIGEVEQAAQDLRATVRGR